MSVVDGWAFKAPEARTQSREAFLDALDQLGITRPEINDADGMFFTRELSDALYALKRDYRTGYAHFTVTLDPSVTGLTDLQKLLIADDGNGCFGGVVNGQNIKVYTD